MQTSLSSQQIKNTNNHTRFFNYLVLTANQNPTSARVCILSQSKTNKCTCLCSQPIRNPPHVQFVFIDFQQMFNAPAIQHHSCFTKCSRGCLTIQLCFILHLQPVMTLLILRVEQTLSFYPAVGPNFFFRPLCLIPEYLRLTQIISADSRHLENKEFLSILSENRGNYLL